MGRYIVQRAACREGNSCLESVFVDAVPDVILESLAELEQVKAGLQLSLCSLSDLSVHFCSLPDALIVHLHYSLLFSVLFAGYSELISSLVFQDLSYGKLIIQKLFIHWNLRGVYLEVVFSLFSVLNRSQLRVILECALRVYFHFFKNFIFLLNICCFLFFLFFLFLFCHIFSLIFNLLLLKHKVT